MARTGCQGPYVNGTGGWCGCNCKCCPPADMVTCVTVKFAPPSAMAHAEEEITLPEYNNLNLPGPLQEMPSFDMKPILSEDKNFLFGGDNPCSVPCATFSINLVLSGPRPLCGFQVNDCNILAVGNGWITATPDTEFFPNCGTIDILLNGMTPPIYVTDGSTIAVTLSYSDDWTCCECVELCPVACMPMSMAKQLLRYKTKEGKIKIDPKTGKPFIVIDKAELLRRVIERRQKLRRKKK